MVDQKAFEMNHSGIRSYCKVPLDQAMPDLQSVDGLRPLVSHGSRRQTGMDQGDAIPFKAIIVLQHE